MSEIRHSVQLDKDKCKGCTNCIKKCPTQAIRVRNGKAKILNDRCIDCGECIRVCPYRAKKAITDTFDVLKNYKFNVAIPAPTLYGQFSEVDDINVILNGLVSIGFDDVFEVAYAAEIITAETIRLRETKMLEKPIINSACPAVVKLIYTRFPNLINNILPMISPMQLAGKMAREEAAKKSGFAPEEIGVFFITPCAAKATCAQYPIGLEKSHVNGSFSIKDVYLKMLPFLKSHDSDLPKLSKAGFSGISWAASGGEAAGAEKENYIAVDGIHNVLKILDEIENDRLQDIDFIELLACTGGCVGGPLTVENAFVAQRRVKNLAQKNHNVQVGVSDKQKEYDVLWKAPLNYSYKRNLDDDIVVAMQKLNHIEELYDKLPKLDCGSCGSPTCYCLAEDIVMGYTNEDSCIVRFKEKIVSLAKSIETAEKIDITE